MNEFPSPVTMYQLIALVFELQVAQSAPSPSFRTIQLEGDSWSPVFPTAVLLSKLHYNIVIIGFKILREKITR